MKWLAVVLGIYAAIVLFTVIEDRLARRKMRREEAKLHHPSNSPYLNHFEMKRSLDALERLANKEIV